MHDPFAWSFPFGRLFGITIRIHILFPFLAIGLIGRAAFFVENPVPGGWIDVSIVFLFLFFSILLHEFGHSFMARAVGGDSNEVLLWPLGGLANCEVPHTPRANFLVAAAGPAVNLFLALVSALVLWLSFNVRPWFRLDGFPGRGFDGVGYPLPLWGGGVLGGLSPYSVPTLVTWFFWVNYFGFLLNMVLIGFPFDAGRMFQSIAWKYVGYRRGTIAAIYAGFVTMFVIGLYGIFTKDALPLFLALFVYVSCKQQWLALESGGEESLFGYDFSQGYTSLERDDQPTTPPKPKQSWWQRWKQKRAERKAREELERRESEERRLDELLEKVARQGIDKLTDEERRFMQRVSDRYRNRK